MISVSITVRPAARRALSATALARLRGVARRMARAAALEGGLRDAVVGLILTDDEEIHALNRAWRKKDKPTDVLAFALREAEGGRVAPEELGDVVISVETARRQAKRGLAAEVQFLWAHGLCHLLGYDHRNDREEREMNARMAALLAEGRRRGRVRAA